MRITTWNVNGLRAACRNGALDVLETVGADVVLLQEIRCRPEQLGDEVVRRDGWWQSWHPAQRPGYAGVAVWSREPMEVVETGLGPEDVDAEGRVLTVETAGVRVSSVYLPSGSSGDVRQTVKELWMGRFRDWLDEQREGVRPHVVGGDLNVARTEYDIFYAAGNARNSGFLPHERAWMDAVVASGWRDFVREAWGEGVHGPYTWWSNRGRARELDRGWRIDYLLGNAAAGDVVGWASVDRELSIGVSDHAPVSVDLV